MMVGGCVEVGTESDPLTVIGSTSVGPVGVTGVRVVVGAVVDVDAEDPRFGDTCRGGTVVVAGGAEADKGARIA